MVCLDNSVLTTSPKVFDSCHADDMNSDLNSAGHSAPSLHYSCDKKQQAHVLFRTKWCPDVFRGACGAVANQASLTEALFLQNLCRFYPLELQIKTQKS